MVNSLGSPAELSIENQAIKNLLEKVLKPDPKVINIDQSGPNKEAIRTFNRRSISKIRFRQCKHINYRVKGDHHFIKLRTLFVIALYTAHATILIIDSLIEESKIFLILGNLVLYLLVFLNKATLPLKRISSILFTYIGFPVAVMK